MNIAFACPKCDATTQQDFAPASGEPVACAHCGYLIGSPAESVEGDKLESCLCCGTSELFIRKDFSQQLGIAIIALGFIISTIFWAFYMRYAAYATLFATALLDLVFYFCVGNLLECYRCHAQYRDMPGLDRYEAFNLETHERFRQQAIRLEEAERAAKMR